MSIQTVGKHDKNGRLIQPTYKDGRTKQSFKDETDIEKMLSRAQAAGTISHLEKYQGSYGDFADFDFFDSILMLTKGREVFDALPSELRSEFNQSPEQFFAYVNDPANKDDLEKKLPMLAEPGRQNIDMSGKTPGEGEKTASADAEAVAAAEGAAAEKPLPAEKPAPSEGAGKVP